MRIETYTIGIEIDSNAANSLKSIDNVAKNTATKINSSFNKVNNNIASSSRRISADISNTLIKTQERLNSIRIPAIAAFGAGSLAIKNLSKDASDLGESINAVNVVFEKSASGILDFSKTAAEEVGLSAQEFNQLSVGIGALLSDTGLSEEELTKRTIELTKRAADLASVFNTDVKDALSAINQAVRGETEAIRRYSGDVTDASLKQFLLAKGVNKTFKELTQQEKRLLRTELLLSQTSKVQGDFRNTSDELANSQRIVAARVQNLSAELGRTLLPVMKSLVGIAERLTSRFSKLSPETQELIVKGLLVGTALAGIAAAASFVIPGLIAIAGAAKLVGGVLVALLLNPVGVIVPALISMAATIQKVGLALKAAFIANPILLAIAGISLVVYDLWKAFNGGDSVLKDIFDWFSERFPRAASLFTFAFNKIVDNISAKFETLFKIFQFVERSINRIIGLVDKIPDKVFTIAGDIASNVGETALKALPFANVTSLAAESASGVANAVSDSPITERFFKFIESENQQRATQNQSTTNTNSNISVDNITIQTDDPGAFARQIINTVNNAVGIPAGAP